MGLVWKVLLGMVLTLPAGAYVAGTVVGPPETAEPPGAGAVSTQAPATKHPGASGRPSEAVPTDGLTPAATLVDWSDAGVPGDSRPEKPQKTGDRRPRSDGDTHQWKREGDPGRQSESSQPTEDAPSPSPTPTGTPTSGEPSSPSGEDTSAPTPEETDTATPQDTQTDSASGTQEGTSSGQSAAP